MIERYILPEMRTIWGEENRFHKMLEIELAVLKVQQDRGEVPPGTWETCRDKAAIDIDRINEIESEVHHDVIAFLTAVAEKIGPEGEYLHKGLTSYDVVDPALSLMMRESADLIIARTSKLAALFKEKALFYKDTACAGRTHGVFAEPTTFGHKLAVFYFEVKRGIVRLEAARKVISTGKLSGAVGTYSNIDPEIEKAVFAELDLAPVEAATQVLQRDRHAEFLYALASIGATIEKFALEVRLLSRSEVGEVQEAFGAKQKGSSAMPHKKNPIICERLCGMARLLRANLVAGFENIALWHERDISHSSVERVIIPDSCMVAYYMLVKAGSLLENLIVNTDRMKRNLDGAGGVVFSSRVLLALVDKGLTRDAAYRLVQKAAMSVLDGAAMMKEALVSEGEIASHLSENEIDELLDESFYLRHLSVIFERLEADG